MWNEFCGVLNEHSAFNLQHCQTSVGDALCIIGVKNKWEVLPQRALKNRNAQIFVN